MHRRPSFSTAFFLDGPLRLFGILILDEVRDRDVGSLTREEDRNRLANAGIAPCNERDFVLELLRTFVVRRIEHWMRPKFGFLARLHWC